MTTKTLVSDIVTDEEIDYYGEKFQNSEEKKSGINFEAYLHQELNKKVKI